jgi:hypothetical protein
MALVDKRTTSRVADTDLDVENGTLASNRDGEARQGLLYLARAFINLYKARNMQHLFQRIDALDQE